MKKALILGAKWNLGSQIIKVFKSSYQLIPLDREEIDLFEISKLASLLEQYRPSIIVNAAAYNQVDNCEKSVKEYDKALFLNSRLPAFLADWCLERGATLVHYSSDYVFKADDINHSGFNEEAITSPINKYGLTKDLGEKQILALADKGLAFYLIRTSKLFGPKGSSLMAKASFFDIMLELSQTRDKLEVLDSEKSCFTYSLDLAQATLSLLDDQAKYGLYHLINEGPVTWYQACQLLFKYLKRKNIEIKPVSQFKRAAQRPNSSILLNTKREKLRPFGEALKDYYKL